MKGTEKVLRTEFWVVRREDLETVKSELETYATKCRTFVKRLERIIQNMDKATEYELEELAFDICTFFNDCRICPLRFDCRFVNEACNEVFMCETCPRLRFCVQDGNKGFVQYVRDSKLGGGFE
jgi:adenine-specific DNA glycosylase